MKIATTLPNHGKVLIKIPKDQIDLTDGITCKNGETVLDCTDFTQDADNYIVKIP